MDHDGVVQEEQVGHYDVSSRAADRLRAAMIRTAELTAARAPTGRSHDDADDVRGTIESDDAVGFDPRPLLAALDRAGARAVVIGQVAGMLHGSTELTGDLDLLWSGRPEEALAMARAFADVGADLADDDGQPLPVDASAFAHAKVVFRTSQASGDCCTPALVWGALDVAGFAARAETAIVDGTTIHYLSLEDLVAMRRAVGRPKDLRRAAELDAIGTTPDGRIP